MVLPFSIIYTPGVLTWPSSATKIYSSLGVFEKLSFSKGFSSLANSLSTFAKIDTKFKKQEAMIQSMTKQERKNPDLLNTSSRKFRIARGN